MWEAECAAVPEFSESAFHIITGLLLPIWDRLPADNMRVYRFETDDGARVIGRLVGNTDDESERVWLTEVNLVVRVRTSEYGLDAL